jgi:tetratricopeptide (TPR) repeat protein
MGRIEKTVFISYRRTNLPWALAIYQNLTAHGYDVFFDFQSIHSGDFEQVILGNIKARAHFLVVLTPSALERCAEPNDWLRREIETALAEKRNIVPLFLEGFNFGSPSITQYLTDKIAMIKNYNGLNIPADYFDEAMQRLRQRYLNVALEAVLHSVSNTVQKVVERQQIAASKATEVKQKELSAQEWFEQGYKYGETKNYDEAIQCYSEAIRLMPDYADAYYNRGIERKDKGDLDGAIKDYTEAIRLKPNFADAFHNRGYARRVKGDLDGAIKDYTEALIANPNNADVQISLMGMFKRLGRHAEANQQVQLIRPLIQTATKYNQACFEALCGNTNMAIMLLKTAIEEKPSRAELARNDADFESIRYDPRFKELVGK